MPPFVFNFFPVAGGGKFSGARKHGANTLQTQCKHGANTVQTRCKHGANMDPLYLIINQELKIIKNGKSKFF